MYQSHACECSIFCYLYLDLTGMCRCAKCHLEPNVRFRWANRWNGKKIVLSQMRWARCQLAITYVHQDARCPCSVHSLKHSFQQFVIENNLQRDCRAAAARETPSFAAKLRPLHWGQIVIYCRNNEWPLQRCHFQSIRMDHFKGSKIERKSPKISLFSLKKKTILGTWIETRARKFIP